jgi:outer membrane protein assembly factor BamB
VIEKAGDFNIIKNNLLKNCWILGVVLLFIVSTTIPVIIGQKTEQRSPSMIDGGLMNSSWPMFHHDVRHTGRSPYGASGNWYEVKWKFPIDGISTSSPAIDINGTIYIGADDFKRSFFAINPNGSEKWHFGVEEFIDSSPAISTDKVIYVGANNGNLYAFYSNGTMKWLFNTGNWVTTSPTIGNDGTIYFGSDNQYFYAMNPNGTEKWHFETGGAVISSAAIGDNGIIYFGSHDAYVYALYPNGTLEWRYKTGDSIKGSPSIGNDGTIYICSWDDYLYAINPNGTMKWKFGTGDAADTTPAIAQDGTIYIGSYDRKIYSIAPNGTENWAYPTGNYVLSSPAIDKNGIIYCGSWDGNLYVLNPDGTLRWTFDTGDAIESSPVIGEDGTIYIEGGQAFNSYLYALQTINDQPPSIPTIAGSSSGKIKQTYNYTIVSTDPEGNNVSYYVDWGDGTNTGWIGPHSSGYELIVNHTWTKQGTYTIKAKAMDNHSAESGWGTLQVTMPLNNNAIYPPLLQLLERFFERHPHAFPFLRHYLIS